MEKTKELNDKQPKYLVRGFDSYDFEYYTIKVCDTYEEAMKVAERERQENKKNQCIDRVEVRMIR